jgi:hypothetical protein
MPSAVETQLHAVVEEAFSLKPLPNSHLNHKFHSSLLQHARANARFDVLTTMRFKNDRFDAVQVQ